MGYEYEGVISEAKRISQCREPISDFTRQRLLALSLMKADEDPVLNAVIMLDRNRLTAERFVERLRARGVDAVYHGNHGRRPRYAQAHEAVRRLVEQRRRGEVILPGRVPKWLEDQGITSPSIRTIRYWLRHGFGLKRRRSHRRRSGRQVRTGQEIGRGQDETGRIRRVGLSVGVGHDGENAEHK